MIFGRIYIVTNKINGKNYVGKTTKELRFRKAEHFSFSRNSSMIFHKALRKYGKENFEWEEISWAGSIEELNKYEIIMIDFYKTKVPNGYNVTDGGEGGGSNPSEEVRKKRGSGWRGKKNPDQSIRMRGNKFSKGKKFLHTSERNKKQIGDKNPFYGKFHTEETKAINRDKHKGKHSKTEFKGGSDHPFFGKKRPEHAEIMKEYHRRRNEINS